MKRKLKITQINIDELIPHPSNPRILEDAIKPVARSIKEFGFINPVIVNEHNIILAGHARTEAAKTLDFDKVPCVKVENLTKAQELAYLLADNRLSENASYDNNMLADVIKTIEDMDFDATVTGYSEDEIEAFINASADNLDDLLGLGDEGENIPETQEPNIEEESEEKNVCRVSFFFSEEQKKIVMDAVEAVKENSPEKISMGAALTIICAQRN